MSDNPSMIPGTPEPNGSAAPLVPSSPQGQASQSGQPQAAGYTNVQQAQPQASQPTQSQAQGQPQQAASSSFGSTQGYSNQGAPQPPYVQQPYAGGYAAPQYAYAPAQAAQPKKGGKGGWIALGIILFAIVFVFTIGALSCSHTVSSLTSGADAFSSMSDEVITSGDSVGVIDMMGTIQYDGSSCSPEGLRDLLKEAEENPDIKAVVLRVDSGGGTATAGEEMAAYVRDFSKPIVVSSASMNCSAAYEISSQADYIYVNETTAIGAIGTIMQVQDISGLLDMLGIKTENIASADSKDSSYGTRPLTDEERQYYQDLVDEINETFIQNVADGRGMSVEEVRELATGLQFAGKTSVENGIADEIGTYDDALGKAAELGGISGENYEVVNLTSTSSDLGYLMDLLGADSGSALDDIDLSQLSAEDLVNLLKEEGVLS
ncbi:MAG TPA: signal peptide peptidase SppA [Slackia equolifaciens]|uniref:Signal peptide peptidase SppA n=1 Tax=Slackia equolifaciens TaxID=498718 RepID=A0A9D3A0D9_9ACTN|nr:signal peptide peptidase SppA [Slackia equolifaciens]